MFLSQHPFVIVVSAFVGNLVILLIILCTDNIPALDDPQAVSERLSRNPNIDCEYQLAKVCVTPYSLLTCEFFIRNSIQV